jgi:hypothetical protein
MLFLDERLSEGRGGEEDEDGVFRCFELRLLQSFESERSGLILYPLRRFYRGRDVSISAVDHRRGQNISILGQNRRIYLAIDLN